MLDLNWTLESFFSQGKFAVKFRAQNANWVITHWPQEPREITEKDLSTPLKFAFQPRTQPIVLQLSLTCGQLYLS